MKKLINQIIKFGFVGVICFVIDYGILVFLREIFNIDILIASAISFTLSTIVNYILSVTWVFSVNKQTSKIKNLVIFIVFSVIGLILTQIIMWIGIKFLDYRIVKIIATAIVMCFNFVTRKIFLEKNSK